MDDIVLAPPGSLAERVCRFLQDRGGPIWLVGGYVRDLLLGRQTNDLDFTVPAEAIPLARAVANHFGGAFFILDERLDMGRAVLREAEQPLIVDICRLRGDDLEADLALRDFTINAMALDLCADPPMLIDRYGGRRDLAARLVRAVGEKGFQRDPVRTLRAVRLAAELGFRLEEETAAWIRRDALRLAWAPMERVRYEMVRIMDIPGAADHLRALDSLNLLEMVLPEVVDLQGVEQPPPHYLDVYEHSLETVRQLEWVLEVIKGAEGTERRTQHPRRNTQHETRNPSQVEDVLRTGLTPFIADLQAHLAQPTSAERTRGMMLKWAALLHDLGKPKARTEEPNGRIRFLHHPRIGAGLAAHVLQRLRFNNTEVRWVKTIIRQHMRPLLLAREPSLTRRAIYRFFRHAGEAGADICLLSLADHLATWGPNLRAEEWGRLVQIVSRLLDAYFTEHEMRVAPRPLLSGQELQEHFGLAEGPRIGALLEALREAQAMGEVCTRGDALAFVRHLLSENVGGRRGEKAQN